MPGCTVRNAVIPGSCSWVSSWPRWAYTPTTVCWSRTAGRASISADNAPGPGHGDVGVGDAKQFRLGGHADHGSDQPAVLGRQDGRDGGALRQGTFHRLGPCVPALPQHPGRDAHLTGPVFGIHHHHAARPHQDMVQVGFGAAGPVDIVQHVPAAGHQFAEPVGHQPLPHGTGIPGFGGPFGAVQLAASAWLPVRLPAATARLPRPLRPWPSLLPCRSNDGGRPASSVVDVIRGFS